MINLLSPDIKQQIRFAKLNRGMLGYLRLTVVVLVVLAGIFGATIYFVSAQADQVARDVASKQQQIAAQAPRLKLARDAADRLTAIKTISAGQTRFSLLLADLAKVLPKGVAIDSITLTGDDKKPVRITILATTYNSVLVFREALASSSRISGVDLESITDQAGSFQASVVIAFKPGQAR